MTAEIMKQKYQRPHSIKNIFWKKKKSLEKSQTASALKKGKKQKLIVFKMSEDQISIDTTL